MMIITQGFDTSAEGLAELWERGKSKTVEFKRRLSPDAVVARILSSFANTDGGILLIGVDEEKGLAGVPGWEVQEILERLQKISDEVLFTPAQINATRAGSGWIPYAIVSKEADHLGPVRTARGEVYVREQSGTRQDLAPETPPRQEKPATSCTVFVAMSFRDEEQPALVDYYEAIKRAVIQTDLPITTTRADQVEGDFEISKEVMIQISTADIMIADFTLSPCNVYFEAGFARGRDKRLIQTAKKETALEFDVRNWKTIFYKNATELEEALVPALRSAYNDWRDCDNDS